MSSVIVAASSLSSTSFPRSRFYLDNGPPNAGPASGGTYIFFVADGVSRPELEASINALAMALTSDLASLEKSTQ